MDVLKVSANSNPNSVAGAIASVVRNCGQAEIQSVGAGATNQAVKSIAVARGYLEPLGLELVCFPEFSSVDIGGEERTAMKFVCFTICENE
ncbi:MAG: stage V sporulation protein S [Oscillospiraceae bacterium]|nr:stage V sporulation protein S [Oscillospiraceae bacterium]